MIEAYRRPSRQCRGMVARVSGPQRKAGGTTGAQPSIATEAVSVALRSKPFM